MMLVITLLAGALAHAGKPEDCEPYWTKVAALNEQYETAHKQDSAVQLWKLLPTGKTLPPEGCQARIDSLDHLERAQDYRAKRILAGDKTAIQLSFRMLNVADGAFAERIDIDLGKIIVKHPDLFLLGLKSEYGDEFCSDGLLANLGEYDLSEKAKKAKLTERETALLSVKEGSLKKLRDLCVSRLKKLQNSK